MIQQWVAEKIRNKMREAMGIPPESKEERHARRSHFRQQGESDGYRHGHRTSDVNRTFSLRRLLHSYAIDIEFTEIHEYSSRTEIHPEGDAIHLIIENQVTDAEYILLQPGNPTDFGSGEKNNFKFWKRNR